MNVVNDYWKAGKPDLGRGVKAQAPHMTVAPFNSSWERGHHNMV